MPAVVSSSGRLSWPCRGGAGRRWWRGRRGLRSRSRLRRVEVELRLGVRVRLGWWCRGTRQRCGTGRVAAHVGIARQVVGRIRGRAVRRRRRGRRRCGGCRGSRDGVGRVDLRPRHHRGRVVGRRSGVAVRTREMPPVGVLALEAVADHLQRQVVLALLAEDEPQAINVGVVELAVAGAVRSGSIRPWLSRKRILEIVTSGNSSSRRPRTLADREVGTFGRHAVVGRHQPGATKNTSRNLPTWISSPLPSEASPSMRSRFR